MAASEEKARILKMLQEGKLTVEEASKLLDALEVSGGPGDAVSGGGEPEIRGRTIRISVTEMDTGSAKVNVNIPLKLAQIARSLIPESERNKILSKGIDLDTVFSTLDGGAVGKILDVEDIEDNHRVEIWIE